VVDPQLRDVMASLEATSHSESHTKKRPMGIMSRNYSKSLVEMRGLEPLTFCMRSCSPPGIPSKCKAFLAVHISQMPLKPPGFPQNPAVNPAVKIARKLREILGIEIGCP
jgi:hypothetical protein